MHVWTIIGQLQDLCLLFVHPEDGSLGILYVVERQQHTACNPPSHRKGYGASSVSLAF